MKKMINSSFNTENRTLFVSDNYRTNPLSHTPGGSTVKVFYPNGYAKVYDKIKNVEAYTRYMKENYNVIDVQEIEDDHHEEDFFRNHFYQDDCEDSYCGACMESPCRCSDPEKTSTVFDW